MKLYDNYSKALDLIEKESDRFWTRNNVFLLVQGAMIAFYSKTTFGSLFSILVSVEGLILALIWIGVLVKGAKYVSRWDDVVRELEAKLEGKSSHFIGLKRLNDLAKGREKTFVVKFLDKRTTVLIRYFIYSLVLFWLVLIILNTIKSNDPSRIIIQTPFSWDILGGMR